MFKMHALNHAFFYFIGYMFNQFMIAKIDNKCHASLAKHGTNI